MRTAGTCFSSAGIGLTSRVSCHEEVAALESLDRLEDRCTNNAIAMMIAITIDR